MSSKDRDMDMAQHRHHRLHKATHQHSVEDMVVTCTITAIRDTVMGMVDSSRVAMAKATTIKAMAIRAMEVDMAMAIPMVDVTELSA